MPATRDLLQIVREMRGRLDEDVSLAWLARRSGWSPFHLHRAFRRVIGETPKQYAQRLRLDRAAAELAGGTGRVVDVAVATGFASHEVFTRAFQKRFGHSPAAHRAMAGTADPAVRARHREIVHTAGPCLGLIHLSEQSERRMPMPTLSIVRKEIAARPVLLVRLNASRQELAAKIAEGAGRSYAHAQKVGAAFAGHPFTRYVSMGPGLMSIEVGMPLDAPAAGEGDVIAGQLPGGAVAMAVHAGPYDELPESWAALERWIEANGHRGAASPWELYVTDPAEHPDPKDWRTEIYWPLAV
jgi:AraC family transcriptional regulator